MPLSSPSVLLLVDLLATSLGNELDLTWKTCDKPEFGRSNIEFVCSNQDTVHRLTALFTLPETMRGFIALDATINIYTDTPSLPAFWHREAGGCNRKGIAITHQVPVDPEQCPNASNPWSPTTQSLITTYASGYNGEPNRALLRCSVVRSSEDTTTLIAGTRYLAFALDFSMDHAPCCDGCSAPAAIFWSCAFLYGTEDFRVLGGFPLPETCVAVNGGNCSFHYPVCPSGSDPREAWTPIPWPKAPETDVPCDPTPVRDRTWGMIKILYR